MSTCNGLDLQTLESQPVMPKNLSNHCYKCSLSLSYHVGPPYCANNLIYNDLGAITPP